MQRGDQGQAGEVIGFAKHPQATHRVRQVAAKTRQADAIDRGDIGAAVAHRLGRAAVTPGFYAMPKEAAVDRERRHQRAQGVVARLGVAAVVGHSAPAQLFDRCGRVVASHHQLAAVAHPLAAGRVIQQTADHTHLACEFGHQRIAAGLTQQKCRIAPVSKQLGGPGQPLRQILQARFGQP